MTQSENPKLYQILSSELRQYNLSSLPEEQSTIDYNQLIEFGYTEQDIVQLVATEKLKEITSDTSYNTYETKEKTSVKNNKDE